MISFSRSVFMPDDHDDPMNGTSQKWINKEHRFVVSNLDRCSGSAMYTLGDNIVQCSIFGPLQTNEDSTTIKKVLSVFLNPLGKINNTMKDKSFHYLEHLLKKLFLASICQKRFPSSRTYVIVNEIEKGNSFLSTSLNATSLAFLDSGYPLSHVIGASTLVLDTHGNFLSPKEYRDKKFKNLRTYEPQIITFETPDNDMKANFTIVAKNCDNEQQIGLICEGRFSLDDLFQAQEQAKQPITEFFNDMREFVRNRLT